MKNPIRLIVTGIGLFLILSFAIGILLNSTRVSAVKVTLLPGAEEHRDKVIFGIGKGEEAPDYNLRIRAGSRWIDCGTFGNKYIANGIDFEIEEMIPLRLAVELQLRDRDKIETDILEQLPINSEDISGNRYKFSITTSMDIQSGLDWFFGTPIGKIISIGIIIAIVILVFSAVG